ncbi:hypothetical protein [Pseudoalteromonas luteoviolacea]|uniref:Baseplate protein J-like domain-containing protein n=1 Tax=Pseudoalteromonas luteoviolacea (strain 2ta16) TaxID=1353533 RepID=V4HR05_PSEL2|nr:hypothetical protein [Pseudoalteromonas luteoviolacea]ESP93270.1 hypothetical protein PL2TA16_03491 [Pseudoalteromonas luteoviolacea 2ta16]KZN36611.1 hypothetical protein N483_22085 [Pseudoalteromonas luteoviolacea NCIMB 1944]
MTFKSRSQSLDSKEIKGLSQTARQIPELSSEFFNIEPRTIEQWLSYLSTVAQHTQFIGQATWQPVQTWYKVIPEPDKFAALAKLIVSGSGDALIKGLASRPDLALLLTFVDLLQHTQQQFNGFVQRHLDHYYRDVLGFDLLDATPDSAHVLIELNEVDSLTLQPGTQFDGGKDEHGQDLVYQLSEPSAINRAVVDNVITVNKANDDSGIKIGRNVLLDTVQGVELESSAMTFGDIEQAHLQPPVEIGFKIASQDLFLSSGKRVIALRFSTDEFGETPIDLSLWLESFDILVSTEDGPIQLDTQQVSLSNNNELVILVDELFAPIAPVKDVFIGRDKVLPYIAFVLKQSKYDALYALDLQKRDETLAQLTRSEIQEIQLAATVLGADGLIANNGIGFLDTSKPFEPFGFTPQLAEKFEFTHPELLCKRVTRASIEFNWVGRPEDFDTHYQTYLLYKKVVTKSPVNVADSSDTLPWPKNQVLISQSDVAYSSEQTKKVSDLFYNDPAWQLSDEDAGLELLPLVAVQQSEELPELVNNVATNRLVFTYDDDNGGADYLSLPFNLTQAKQWPKWYTLELSNQDFGHPQYTKVSEYYAFQNSMKLANWDPNDGDFIPTQVLEPYTPLLDSVKLHYRTQSISRAQRDAIGNAIWIEHISPIGRQLQILETQNSLHLLPEIDELGYLYIALGELPTPGQCSVLFQLEAVDGYNFSEPPQFKWEYYNQGRWHHFSRDDSQGSDQEGRILQDNTYDLLDSGIIIFSLPEFDLTDQFNQDGKVWIRAVIDSETLAGDYKQPIYSKLKGVYSQAVQITLNSTEHAQSHYLKPLEAGSIGKLLVTDPSITSVVQPFDSFGAKVKEDDTRLYRRVSERLRHRDRLLTAWDYEHFILQAFPELHSVTAYQTKDGVNITVIPLNHDTDILQPKVPRYLMRKIQEEVEARSVPGLNVRIEDPKYVEVQLEIIIQIDPRFDIQTTVVELNELIVETLTPWNKPDSELSKTIFLTDVAQALEAHQAVNMVQVIRGKRLGEQTKEYAQISPKTCCPEGCCSEDCCPDGSCSDDCCPEGCCSKDCCPEDCCSEDGCPEGCCSKNCNPSDGCREILVPTRNHKISLTNVDGDVFEGIGKWKIQHNFVVQ